MALSYTSGVLNWPTHVRPASIQHTVFQPTQSTRSFSGKKYARSFNYTKQGFSVNYPPMNAADAQLFYAAALAMRGQYGVCWFSLLGTDGEKLWMPFQGDDTMTPAVNQTYTVGTGNLYTQIELKSLPVSTSEPIPPGSIISGLGRNYGHIQTVLACTDSDGSGIATITLDQPIVETVTADDPVDVDPEVVLVSLTEDSFSFNLSTIKYYGFSIEFEFDRLYD